jgi:hypothetical protein
MDLETYRAVYTVGLAQHLDWTGDIEQQQASWKDHEHRDPANFTSRLRFGPVGHHFIVRMHCTAPFMA